MHAQTLTGTLGSLRLDQPGIPASVRLYLLFLLSLLFPHPNGRDARTRYRTRNRNRPLPPDYGVLCDRCLLGQGATARDTETCSFPAMVRAPPRSAFPNVTLPITLIGKRTAVEPCAKRALTCASPRNRGRLVGQRASLAGGRSAQQAEAPQGVRPGAGDASGGARNAGLDLTKLERFAFYEAAGTKDVTLTIATGEQRLYANILLTIGVVGG